MKEAAIICFSPNGNSHIIAKRVEEVVNNTFETQLYDITLPSVRIQLERQKLRGDHLFLIIPVYAQGIPELVKQSLRSAQLFFEKATIILTYGNVHEGVALSQAIKLLKQQKIEVVSAATLPMKHSYEFALMKNVAEAAFLEQEFLAFIMDSLSKTSAISRGLKRRTFTIARLFPQKALAHIAISVPRTDESKCNHCGQCMRSCPVGAITSEVRTKNIKCIRCGACINRCNKQARMWKLRFKVTKYYLEYHISKEKSIRYSL